MYVLLIGVMLKEHSQIICQMMFFQFPKIKKLEETKIGRNMKGPKVMHHTTYTLKATPSNKQKLAYRTSKKKLILAAALVSEKHLFTVEAL